MSVGAGRNSPGRSEAHRDSSQLSANQQLCKSKVTSALSAAIPAAFGNRLNWEQDASGLSRSGAPRCE